jgi:hypothetical protein
MVKPLYNIKNFVKEKVFTTAIPQIGGDYNKERRRNEEKTGVGGF